MVKNNENHLITRNVFVKYYAPNDMQNFMNLALAILELFCWQDFTKLKYPSKKGHNLIKYL